MISIETDILSFYGTGSIKMHAMILHPEPSDEFPFRYTEYMDCAVCRLCGVNIGDGEFTLRDDDGETYRWPSGYLHYIDVHKVEPSSEFARFVENITIDRSICAAQKWNKMIVEKRQALYRRTGTVLIEIVGIK
jgi:hypothetical protein